MTHRLFSCLGLLGLAFPASAEPIATVKAKTEEPVLEELLAGCSLRCSFRWTVEIRSPNGQAKAEKRLNDESAQTAWMVPDATASGTRVALIFPKKLPAEIDGHTPLYGLDLINGYWKTEETWEQHARLKKARLYYNGKPFRDVTFADSRRWQRVTFPDFFVRSGDSMTLEILETYPGTGGPLALTEIVLQGGH